MIFSVGSSRYYEPQVESINSVQEADAYEKFILSALELIQLSKVSISPDANFCTSIS